MCNNRKVIDFEKLTQICKSLTINFWGKSQQVICKKPQGRCAGVMNSGQRLDSKCQISESVSLGNDAIESSNVLR